MKKIYFVALFSFFFLAAFAQQSPFWNEVQAFKQKDAISKPVGNEILFIGSSSFTKWTDVQNYFPSYPILNRAFGGSSFPHLIKYADDIIFAYQPRQIVIYCGDNDLAASDTVTAQTVYQRFQTLYTLIRSKMPEVSVVYVSIKPSPSRERLLPKIKEVNSSIEKYLSKEKNAVFVDVFHKMLNKDKSIKGELFLADRLHMNAKGYAIWQKAIAPCLIPQNKSQLHIATYNLRLNIPSDEKDAWPYRKEMVKDLIQYHGFDIFGVQEALHDQMMDLATLPNFSYVGAGRDDGNTKGEYSAIFYNNKKYEVLNSNTFWLSPTPEKPSKGWDAAYIRVCTWASFKDKKTGKIFFMFNTHFDNEGVQARENAAKMILEKIDQVATKNAPVIITGDFNSEPTTSAYGTIAKKFNDAKLISRTKPYGPEGTFNGFKYHDYNETIKEGRIDFVFVNNNIEVLKYGVLTDSKAAHFPSDHFPVACTLKF